MKKTIKKLKKKFAKTFNRDSTTEEAEKQDFEKCFSILGSLEALFDEVGAPPEKRLVYSETHEGETAFNAIAFGLSFERSMKVLLYTLEDRPRGKFRLVANETLLTFDKLGGFSVTLEIYDSEETAKKILAKRKKEE